MIRPLQIRPFLLKTLPLLSLGFTFLLFEPAAGIPKAVAAAGVPAADEAATVAQAASDEPVGTVEALGPPVDVWDRIRRGYAMSALENDKVDRWLEYYRRKPDYLNRMFERSGRYLYHILEEVENRGMPTELALLPFVESAFQPEALSRAKAAGLWQFMPATGTHYSLEQNLWRDDRRDVLESTRAALDYFEYLYGMFSDWHLALAAYNWGEGSVQRAIRRQQARKRPADYQHLRMPNETANYVPKLEAIKRIVTDPSKYGVKLPDVGNEPFFVTVTKPRDIDTETAAELAGMPLKEFRQLNPSFKLPVIVASHNNVMLLPADKVDEFIDNLASWMDGGQPLSRWTTYKLQEGETLASVAEAAGMTEDELRDVNGIPKGRRVLANSTLLVRANADDQTDIAAETADAKLRLSPLTTWRRVTYRVRKGDTLSGIARRWHITKKSIVQANRLRSQNLRVGQRLILTVPNVERAPIRTVSTDSGAKHVIHAVKAGETLGSISRRYGVSTAILRATNRISGNTIRAGQRLRIPTVASVEESDVRVHTVRKGDTLYEIADHYDVSVVRLKRANRLTGNALRVGQRLEIPTGSEPKAPAVQPSRADESPEAGLYRVKSGDTLYEIAGRFGVSVNALKAVNGLSGSSLRAGQKLVIPATAKTQPSRADSQPAGSAQAQDPVYRVKSGDTLSSIASRFGTSVRILKDLNGLRSNRLSVGQRIRLP